MNALVYSFTGSLLGSALGDAMGAPFEGSPLSPDFSRPAGRELIPGNAPLRYTDDTEMMINLTESILAEKDVLPGSIAKSFASGMDKRRGYGTGTLRALSLISSGMPFSEASRMAFPEGSFGNGAAMRVAPAGLLYWWDRNRLSEAAIQASITTHAHPLAIEGARIISAAVGFILEGFDLKAIPDAVLEFISEEIFIEKINLMKGLLHKKSGPADVAQTLGSGVPVYESVPTALYAFLKFGESFEEMIDFCISLGGDTDTTGAMAGALSGALLGEEGLPGEKIRRLEASERIRSLAEKLYYLSEKLRMSLAS